MNSSQRRTTLRGRPAGFVVAALFAGTAFGLACGDSTAGPVPPRPDPPDAQLPATVTITPSSARFSALGATSQLTAQVRNRSGQILTTVPVAWTIEDESVATVDASGLVTSRGNGSTTVTAAAGNVAGTAPVEVSQIVRSISLLPTTDTLVVGDTLRFTAEPLDGNGQPVAGATTGWSSSDPSVAEVDRSGLATAVGPGRAEILATSGGVAGRARLIVTLPIVKTVTVTPPEIEFMALGDTIRLTAQVLDERDRIIAVIPVAWGSADTAVATVDSAGLVTATGNGQTRISATAGEVSGRASVRVGQSAASVVVSPAADTLFVGDTLRFTARVTDANGQPVAGALVNWVSSDTSVVRVDSAGLTRAVGPGEAVITATSGGLPGQADLLVMALVPTIVTVIPERTNFTALGDTIRLLAEVRDQVGRVIPGAVVAWTSRDETVAAVDSAGLVTAVENGNTRVEAAAGSATDSVVIEVAQQVDTVIVSPAADTIGGGDRLQLTAEAFDANGHAMASAVFRWTSSDPSVARVYESDPGLVFARAEGTATITATTGRVSGRAEITVWTPDPHMLRALYEATGGSNWTNNENWLTDAPLEDWHGVGTDSHGRVRRLYLGSNNLTGPIPPELGNIPRLNILHLPSNSLAGPIPPEVGKLSRLQQLNLESNDLTGSIPPGLGNLPELGILQLGGNSLTGFIPPELGNAPMLGWIELYGNSLTGPVPAELGSFSLMSRLYLQDNELTGPLPGRLARLNGMRRLTFHDNRGLCAPGSAEFVSWLGKLEILEGPLCNESDVAVLESLYESTRGGAWSNADGWLSNDAVETWHGVRTDSLGHVRRLDLGDNGLMGRLPAALGTLAYMSQLRVSGNPLTGPLPLSLANLPLSEFHYADTDLCVPNDVSLGAWLGAIESHQGTGKVCGAFSDRDVLVAFYEATGGSNWRDNSNWLTEEPLNRWFGVAADDSGRILGIYMGTNNLRGPIPPELGRLTGLTHVFLENNGLSGPIPPALGNLTSLRQLTLSYNNLSGPIPPEIGNLADLQHLSLRHNNLSGSIPPQIGNMGRLLRLQLEHNDLEGQIPAELGGLTSLRELNLAFNRGLSGSVPTNLTTLHELDRLQAGGTGLCAPSDVAFQEWLEGVRDWWLPLCDAVDGGMAYLTQAVQSSTSPVPLVAGEAALLRVFVTAERTELGMPPVRASFYLGGSEAHVVNIPGQSNPIPREIDESSLSNSANVTVPAEVVQPGLEMVIEIDPDETLASELGVTRRIPETGRSMVDVRELPPLELTLIPFLSSAAPHHAVLEYVSDMATDPAGHERLFETRTLLPVAELNVTAHEPVRSSTTSFAGLLAETDAIRVAEGIGGYAMGMITGRLSQGIAHLSGKTSFSTPTADVMAHELGHNFSLLHAPCGGPRQLDALFPERNGRIGGWGYDARDAGKLVWPSAPDLMSYCRPRWIGPYSFSKALRYRLAEAMRASAVAMAAAARSLLVWGGIGADGRPFLEPTFVIDAPSVLPRSGGAYEVTALTTNGEEAFSFRFDMPEVADGEGGSGFAFAVPARPSWEASLASITLSGLGGSVTLDQDTNRPMVILRNPDSGQIRGFLRDLPADVLARASAAELGGDAGLEVLVSRGLPDAAAWRR
ncbi:Ig-like domain-containing protein [Candidatus Palauibacter sp.]|uniref:Ig-like domain-containing protein n=1 Tax=Candidatus Palauibacter sp. TaxID=3101350 RepID=UPI003B522E36